VSPLGDELVSVRVAVLVDQRGPRRGVAHPVHEFAGSATPPLDRTRPTRGFLSDTREWTRFQEALIMILMEIREFDSPQHFSDFYWSIEDAVKNKELASVPVEQPYSSVTFEERWYRTQSGQVWRLVSPDFPFKGVFEQVT
jgi:hypothetical protein